MAKKGAGGSDLKGFALAGFLLLAVLFGMQIMTFIFGNLGPENSGLTEFTEAYNVSREIQNDSLQAISNYSTQAGTQFTTLGIAITLVILVLVFAFFWRAFMGGKNIGDTGGAGSFA